MPAPVSSPSVFVPDSLITSIIIFKCRAANTISDHKEQQFFLTCLNHRVLLDWQQGAQASRLSPVSLGWETQPQLLIHLHWLSSSLNFISDVSRISSRLLKLHGLVAISWYQQTAAAGREIKADKERIWFVLLSL